MTEVLTADVLRQYPPGRGGSVCKRIRRTALRYVTAWCLKRKRWPKHWNKMRKHGWQTAGMTPGRDARRGNNDGR